SAGVNRILIASGVLDGELDAEGETQIVTVNGFENYVYAPEGGLFEPLAELGESVSAGQPAALIHCPDTPWRQPAVAAFETSGKVLCRRFPSLTKRGDCLYEVGGGS